MYKDPNGFDQHMPGAKLDSGKNRMSLVLMDFARALEEVSKVGTYGANKYTEHGWLRVPNGLERYSDAMFRHLFSETKEERDEESGILHAAHAAWNALARLELMLKCHTQADAEPVTTDGRLGAGPKTMLFSQNAGIAVRDHGA